MRHIGPIRLHAGGPEVWKLASVHLSNRGSIGVKPKGAGVLVGCVCWFPNRGSTGTRPVGAAGLQHFAAVAWALPQSQSKMQRPRRFRQTLGLAVRSPLYAGL